MLVREDGRWKMLKQRSQDVPNSRLRKKKCPKEYKYILGKIDFGYPLT